MTEQERLDMIKEYTLEDVEEMLRALMHNMDEEYKIAGEKNQND